MSGSTILKSGLAEIVALVGAVGGLIVYLITSTTGYLAGRPLDALPIVLTVAAALALITDLVWRARLRAIVRDLLVIGSLALLAWAFALFLLARVPLAADVYFIPVNYPEAEGTTLSISFIGLGLYVVAIVALVVEAFAARRLAAANWKVAVG